jgi:RimJ/RimL family protein N-acetyltransferase
MRSLVTLREVTHADVDVFFAHQRDPEANDMAAFPARDKEAHERHWATKILNDPTAVSRTIVVGHEVAGNIVSWLQGDMRLIGYWLGRDHWGKGIATSALAQFVDLLPERPLYAYVAKHNAGSVRVLEKCGFEQAAEELGEDGVVELLMTLRT